MSRVIGAGLQDRLREANRAILRGWPGALSETGDDVQRRYIEVVRNWSRKPSFTVTLDVQQTFMSVTVRARGPRARIFRWVDQGTRGPYIIRAKNPSKPLRFQVGGQPKTLPGARANVGTGAKSGAWVSKIQIIHPGIRKRGFTDDIIQSVRPEFLGRIASAYKDAVGGN